MSVIGETRVRFGRSYVFLNPDTSISTPDDARVGTWRLSREEDSENPLPPVVEGSLGFLIEVRETGGISTGQLVRLETDGAYLAKADAYSTAVVGGVAISSGNQGEIITVTRNETVDFFDVAGQVDGGGTGGYLTTGDNYYLSATTAGNWTTTPDTTTAGAVVAQVGTAVGPNKMTIEIQQPLVI